jgi:hypothetical protein
MLPIGNRHGIIDSLVPNNPKPGQIYTMPDGQVLGASHVISLMKESLLIGDSLQFTPIPNVTGKNVLTRTTTCIPLKKGMRVKILVQQFSFKSAIFIQYFGWMGHETIDPTIILDKLFRIEHVLRVGPNSDKFFIYEKVCLTTVEEKI